MRNREILLSEICGIIDSKFIGKDRVVKGLNNAGIDSIYDSLLTYCVDNKYLIRALKSPVYSAIITTKTLYGNLKNKKTEKTFFIVDNPTEIFYGLHNYLYKKTNFYNDFNFKRKIGDDCKIHSSSVIEEGVIIGNNVIIEANVVIKKGSVIGNNVVIDCNTVIGADCIEVKRIDGKQKFINHSGGIKIGDNSRIGACSTIGKNLFEGYCKIGYNNFLDNSVHIAHNNSIGNENIFAAGVITAGSVIVGNNCFIGIGSKVSNSVKIGSKAKINIGSVVVENVKEEEVVAGNYAMENNAWLLKIIEEKRRFLRKNL